MDNISTLNVDYFVRDYMSLKSGNGKTDLRKIASLRRDLMDLSSELEASGYSLVIDIRPRDYYTHKDYLEAYEEDEEVQKDIHEYFKEML